MGVNMGARVTGIKTAWDMNVADRFLQHLTPHLPIVSSVTALDCKADHIGENIPQDYLEMVAGTQGNPACLSMKTLRITEFPKAWDSRLPSIEFCRGESDTSSRSPQDQPLPQPSSSQHVAWYAEDSPDKRSDGEVAEYNYEIDP